MLSNADMDVEFGENIQSNNVRFFYQKVDFQLICS